METIGTELQRKYNKIYAITSQNNFKSFFRQNIKIISTERILQRNNNKIYATTP